MSSFAMPRLLLIAPLLVILAGCDQLGLETATAAAARHEAEGRAIGGACRHAGRAIEDCFALNRKTDKAAIYAGWREMDDYMRENKIQVVRPALPASSAGRQADANETADAPDSATPADPAKGDKLAAREPSAAQADKPAARQ
jgi:hypothetical protein